MASRVKQGSTDPSDLAAAAAEAVATEEALTFEAYGLSHIGGRPDEEENGDLLMKKESDGDRKEDVKGQFDGSAGGFFEDSAATALSPPEPDKIWQKKTNPEKTAAPRKALVIAPAPTETVEDVISAGVGNRLAVVPADESGSHVGNEVMGIDHDAGPSDERRSDHRPVASDGREAGTAEKAGGEKKNGATEEESEAQWKLRPKKKRKQYKTEEERKKARIMKNRRTAEESRQRRLKRFKELEEIAARAHADRKAFEEKEHAYKEKLERARRTIAEYEQRMKRLTEQLKQGGEEELEKARRTISEYEQQIKRLTEQNKRSE